MKSEEFKAFVENHSGDSRFSKEALEQLYFIYLSEGFDAVFSKVGDYVTVEWFESNAIDRAFQKSGGRIIKLDNGNYLHNSVF